MSESVSEYPNPLTVDEGSIFTNRRKLVIGLVVLVAALVYLAFLAFQSATVYYYTVGELNELGTTPNDRVVRVSGKLMPASFQRQGDSTVAEFSLSDGYESLRAVHDGVLPDLFFNEHSDIILEGTRRPDGVFQSQNVIVKCPSKYITADERG